MRRLAALLLILCLAFCLLPTMSAASGISVCFIAANDNLLELSYQPYWQGSTIYVPYTVFVNFKIYNSFHQSSNTASLYSSTKQLYFNLDSGETYDGNGTYYNVTPISRGGQVYVPLDFICGQYGLNWSYINSSNSFIDVCRISDANVILSNDQFLTAAKPLMETRYNAYVSSNGGSVDWGGGGGSSSENDSIVYLSFVGLPSGTLLESLASYGVKATFFLTAAEIRESPATVRQIVGQGHNVGALCSADPAAEHAEISSLLYDAAHVKTLLVASASPEYDDICRHAAEIAGLVFWDYDTDCIQGGSGLSYISLITAYLDYRPERLCPRILCCEATDSTLPSVLAYIKDNAISTRAPAEVGALTDAENQ